jgi:endonuclease/exonuclease/phosphatase family metal-dependent hydrolase
MKFTVLNWNIGGAKFLEEKKDAREVTRSQINHALRTILTDRAMGPQPDVVTLQEIVQYKEPGDQEMKEILDEIPGYSYFPFKLIDSKILSSKAKWNKVAKGGDWPPGTSFAQGNGFLIKDDAPHFPVWDLSDLGQPRPGTEDQKDLIEHVHLESGLYFGDRDTEPRAALVAHFIYDPKDLKVEKKPLDIFVVNLHLTTLAMEREGVPEIDMLAVKKRQVQLDVVFNGVVSRYNSWRQGGYLQRGNQPELKSHETNKRHAPVWIIAGDYNFTEESAEYAYIKSMNFIDTVPTLEQKNTAGWGHGTKASGVGQPPTLTLDYIFAGPRFISLHPAISLHQNRVIHDPEVRASDHYPLLSSMNLEPL